MAVIYEAADDLTLSGSVRSQAEHDRPMPLARDTEGVTRVVDHLEIRRKRKLRAASLLRGAKVLVEPAEHLAGQVGALPADVVRRLK